MDPSMMGAPAGMPVDPAMAGAAPAGAPMDPAMMGGAPMGPGPDPAGAPGMPGASGAWMTDTLKTMLDDILIGNTNQDSLNKS